MKPSQVLRVATAQVAPAFLDLPACLEIAEQWIKKAAAEEVDLLVFPETWLPGYPFWLDVSPEAGLWDHPPAKAVFRRMFENALEIPSPEADRLCQMASEAGVALVMGMSEREGGTLYNSMLYINQRGEILGLHRKLIPTYTERLVWGRGDGGTLTVVDMGWGRVGGLVCWEHWMPLARQAMHEQQETIHAAVWPWVKELNLLASRSYAFEGRCFVVAAGAVLRKEHLPQDLELLNALPQTGAWLHGGSAIIGPDANLLAGPATEEELLLLADCERNRITEEKMTLDVAGHYARPDVFHFGVKDGQDEVA